VTGVVRSTAGRFALLGAVLFVIFAGLAIAIFAGGGPPPQQRLFDVQVVGNTMTPSTLSAYYNDTLTITVHTDKDEEIHLHGYDKAFFSSSDHAASLTFPANIGGTFVLEIEATSTPVGTLNVQPRGGLFGIGTPTEHSNTTIVKNAAGTVIRTASTDVYNLSLEVGPIQPMYTPQQFSSLHPKKGEIMFTGTMVMPPGMETMTNMDAASFPPGWKHLEIHVYDNKTGDPVRDLNPQITVVNTASGQSQQVPIVTMQGIPDGPKDFHYGNNVQMPPGNYVVDVQMNAQRATFTVSF